MYQKQRIGTIIANALFNLNTDILMKNALILGLLLSAGTFISAQSAKLPSVKLKDLSGNTIDTGTLSNDGKPMLICFWATWCSPCKKELNTYAELYDDWREETGVKIVAVTIDDQRSVARVGPYVNSVSWEYDILLDVNKEFARALGVNDPPQTFIVDGKGEVVWKHVGFADGVEDEVFKELQKLKP